MSEHITVERLHRIQTALRNARLPDWALWTLRDLDHAKSEVRELIEDLKNERMVTRPAEPDEAKP